MNFKAFLQKKSITDDAFSKMDASEQAKLHGEFLDEMAKTSTEATDKIKTLETELETMKATAKENEGLKSVVDTLKETVEKQGEELVEQGKQRSNRAGKTFEAAFKAVYDESVVKESNGSLGEDFKIPSNKQLVIETKDVVSTDVMPVDNVSAGTFPESGATGVVGAGILRTLYSRLIGFAAPRIPASAVMDYVDVQPLNEATLVVINESWTGTAEVTAECALKPIVKMAFTPQEATADPVVAMWFTTTKLRRFFSNLVNRMEQKFAELVNKEVPEVVLTAIRSGATAFTPDAALAINDNPNNYDALGAVIATLENLDYMPNVIMMNPIAWRNMKQEKNAEGIYTLSNGQSIQLVDIGLDWGDRTIRYVKDPKLGIDEFIVGDLMETVKVGVDSQLMYMETDGRVDAQADSATTGLARNIRTHVLEKFVAVIIPTGSRAGLVRDTFSNVKTLITAEPTT